MGLVPEWVPIIGKRNVVTAPTGPSVPSATEAVQTQTAETQTTATESAPNTVLESPVNPSGGFDSPVAVSPDLANPMADGSPPALGGNETISAPQPFTLEASTPPVDPVPIETVDSAKDDAIGMAAMSNAFPGTVMQAPQESSASSPVEEKPAA